ncbi:MAG: hypothetical protein CL758_06895 [Chloroflexi bacterium]|nr:hypothetical protein [Chloroflexota bacterium]|tara:strand:+ start:7090 stop:8322 length:1233 start_codon:yes stop_codon:yes gene_type:complete
MLIIHAADIHIGVENYSTIDPETGLSTRLLDFLKTFDEVVNYAINNKADLVLLCGDMYKNRNPTQTHQREFAKRISRLSLNNIPVVLVVGNHDVPHVLERASALEIFGTLYVPNIYIGDSIKTHLIKTSNGDIQIITLPWIRRSGFLSREDTRDLTPNQINETIQERLSHMIKSEAKKLDPSTPAILAGHVTVSGAKTSSEQLMTLGRDYLLLTSDIGLPEFDYIALGHIHKHQILNKNPHVVYSGSLERIDFGEENDIKGFCSINIDPKEEIGNRLIDFKFIETNARKFNTININIPDTDENPNETIISTIKKFDIKDSIIRVNIESPINLKPIIQENDIRMALKESQYIASISTVTNTKHNNRLGIKFMSNMGPNEYLKKYFESKNFDSNRIDTLMKYASELMEDEKE